MSTYSQHTRSSLDGIAGSCPNGSIVPLHESNLDASGDLAVTRDAKWEFGIPDHVRTAETSRGLVEIDPPIGHHTGRKTADEKWVNHKQVLRLQMKFLGVAVRRGNVNCRALSGQRSDGSASAQFIDLKLVVLKTRIIVTTDSRPSRRNSFDDDDL